MIAQIVFDLPLEGPFDYSVPDNLASAIGIGLRVKAPLGPRTMPGFVVGIIEKSSVPKLKSIAAISETSAVFNGLDLAFARDFSAHYGCSLGEALAAILRHRSGLGPGVRRDHEPVISFTRCDPGRYAQKVGQIVKGYPPLAPGAGYLVLVPDAFRGHSLFSKTRAEGGITLGTRSAVFECDGRHPCVIMIDEEDASYKQEQTPMYETRQVLLSRARMYGFDVAFIGISPSVEIMALAAERKLSVIEDPQTKNPAVKVVDLSNYKSLGGMISPPVWDMLNAAMKAGQKSLLVLNRRGSYRVTRCVDCGEVLKCDHCEAPLTFSRSEGKYRCPYCPFAVAGDIICPKCHKPSWRSLGIGVEQLQNEIKKLLPQARIQVFQRASASGGRGALRQEIPADFDVLIATKAILRFQGALQVQAAALIDFDAELNRLDMRSAFNAFSLALHAGSMAREGVYIQTRNAHHYVLQSLSSGKVQDFYDRDMRLRKELGFSPFTHWVRVSWRGKSEKSTHEASWQVYNDMIKARSGHTVTPPLADAVGRKRDQFTFHVMVQAKNVAEAVAFIKGSLARVKRPSRVIVTLNVDP